MAATDNVSPAQFGSGNTQRNSFSMPDKPSLLNIKHAGDPKAVSEHAQNIVKTYDTATSQERHGGYGWYASANREATRMAMSHEPGPQHPAKPGKQSVYTHGPTQEAVRRQAGNIAALSPSMDWTDNLPAAKQIHSQTPEQIKGIRDYVGAQSTSAELGRAVKKTGKDFGVGSPEHTSAVAAYTPAKATADELKGGARAHLKGLALNKQSGTNILKAYDIHSGARSPDEALPSGIKTHQFMDQIAEPQSLKGGATIDYRSHDIAMGHHFPVDADRGLSNQNRYNHFQEAHRVAAEEVSARTGLPHTPHQLQAITWVADKRSMTASGGGGKHRHGEAIHSDAAMADTHRNALAEPPNAPGRAAKEMTNLNTAGRNRHGDDL